MEEGLERKLTVVAAPAGYGKTAALVDFAQRSEISVCWYLADDRDRDLTGVVGYVLQAIAECFPAFGERVEERLDVSSGEFYRDPSPLVDALVGEIAALDRSFALVIDNYEVLEGALGLRVFFQLLLDRLPPNAHLMIGSRVLPEVPVTRLVAERQIVGLTERDLRFSIGEIADLFAALEIDLPAQTIAGIAQRSEGWITGVLLMAKLADESDAASLIAGREPATYGYLAREVLNRQPFDVRHFLQETSILREISPRLCAEILDLERPDELLSELMRRNLFLSRFGQGRGAVYRYHNLFRELLRERLCNQDAQRFYELHRRAAEWFERSNETEEAVYHYLEAEAFAEAGRLMERAAVEWFMRGRVGTLIRWAEALPESFKRQAPRMALYHSRVLTDRYDYEGARRALSYAEEGFAEREDLTSLAKVHTQRATLHLFASRYEATIEEAQQALGLLGPEKRLERANALRHLGRGHVGLGQIDRGVEELEQALALFRQIDDAYDEVNVLQDLTLALSARGDLDEAVSCLNKALAIARRLGAGSLLSSVLNNLACLQHDREKYQVALSLYEEGLTVARRSQDRWPEAYICAGMADLYRNLGDYRRARSLCEAAERLAGDGEPALALYSQIVRAGIHRWQGECRRALTLVEEAERRMEAKALSDVEGRVAAAKGITLVECGYGEEGLALLERGDRFYDRRGERRELTEVRFLLAVGYFRVGDTEHAVEALEKALAVCEQTGAYRAAIAEGQHVEELVELGVKHGVPGARRLVVGIERLRDFAEAMSERDESDEELTHHLMVHALGGGRVLRDGREVEPSAWRAAMAKELFFYLLLHGPLERDEIALTFWPDAPTKKMRNSFHTTLYRLRQAVGEGVVVVEDGRYQVGDVDCWFDVEEFEALVERARLLPPQDWQAEDLWRRALDLYEGDFLPEVDRAWAIQHREALRETYLEVLEGIGRAHEMRHEFDEAIEWYQRALEIDELREDIHRRVMAAFAEAGRRSEALAQYETCRRIIADELGLSPSEETRQLYERIVST